MNHHGVFYRLLCLRNASVLNYGSDEFIFYAYKYIKYFDTKFDRVKIHNSSVYFCTWGPVERVSWARFVHRSLNTFSVWNITNATMHILL